MQIHFPGEVDASEGRSEFIFPRFKSCSTRLIFVVDFTRDSVQQLCFWIRRWLRRNNPEYTVRDTNTPPAFYFMTIVSLYSGLTFVSRVINNDETKF